MFKYFFVLFCILIFLSMGWAQEPEDLLYKVADKSQTSVSEALLETIHSQVFFVGEHHDSPQHHFNQLRLIREIHEISKKPLSIGLEMFETGYQHQLDQWVNGTLPLDVFMEIYQKNWGLPWILYRDIFFYAKEHQIPLIALNVPRQIVNKVARKGFNSLTMDDLVKLPEGITCDVTPEYESFIERVFG